MRRILASLLCLALAAPALAQDISNPQTNASALTAGTLPAGRMPALTGGCTTSAGAVLTNCSNPILLGSGSVTMATNTTNYLGVGGSDTIEAGAWFTAPYTGTFGNLRFTASSVPGAAQSYTVTIRVAVADTTVTCSITGTGGGSCSDLTHTTAVNAGDLVSVKVVISNGANAAKANAAFTYVHQ